MGRSGQAETIPWTSLCKEARFMFWCLNFYREWFLLKLSYIFEQNLAYLKVLTLCSSCYVCRFMKMSCFFLTTVTALGGYCFESWLCSPFCIFWWNIFHPGYYHSKPDGFEEKRIFVQMPLMQSFYQISYGPCTGLCHISVRRELQESCGWKDVNE